MTISHYANDSASPDWLLMSANLEHVASGVCIEYRDGLITIDGVVSVNSLPNATELLADVIAAAPVQRMIAVRP